MDKAYNPHETEDRIYKLWQESGAFAPQGEGKPYTVMIAPPNITGSLHMGHALENTISDILVRYHRMNGYRTLWVPGVDHAGISAQSKVEKELLKEGVKKHDLGRDAFIKKIEAWKEQYGGIILDQLKKLGFSLDWSHTAYTMDASYQEEVKRVFLYYKDKGWIYKGKRIINWSVKDQTALSDLEVYYQEQTDTLYYLNYGTITVATTRPETMLGDTAVAVHPGDERYKALIGTTITLPITGRTIPIIADHAVEKEFGTGAVKVTPAHDLLDFEIGERHGLEKIEVINKFGKINEGFGKFSGMKVAEARKAVAEELASIIVKTEAYTHNVAYGERCQTVIEPLLSEQWFLKMKESGLAQKVIDAITSGAVHYHPEKWGKDTVAWLENIHDWNISRQIWWGHKIPIEDDTDVLDTWFSAALWPLAALPKEYYPTQMITAGRDIRYLWIVRMIFSGLQFRGQVPFSQVIIHGTVLDKSGKRMSKSLGTGVDPLDLIAKYGADAVRFGLIYQSIGMQQDIKYGEEFILTGKKFANKLWNIARYVQSKMPNDEWRMTNQIENEIMAKTKALSEQVTGHINAYEFGEALHLLYDFIWHEYADKYIESTKDNDDDATRYTLHVTLQALLRLLHPFMPFVTEEIWGQLPSSPNKKLLILESWPL